MTKRVKPSEAFEPNASTTRDIAGALVGRYAPTGPNKWDELELTREDGDRVEVPNASRVHVEPIGPDPEVRFRLRKGKEVLVLRWIMTEEDEKQVASGKWGVQEAEQASWVEKVFGVGPKNDPRDDMHEYFLDVVARPLG